MNKKYKSKSSFSSKELFDFHKPKFNGFSNGAGVHGDIKYNRRNYKKETRRLIEEE